MKLKNLLIGLIAIVCLMSCEKKEETLELICGNTTIKIGETTSIHPTVDSKYATWWSDDNSIATVDENGNVKGIKEGEVLIYCAITRQTASISITVTPNLDGFTLNLPDHIMVGDKLNLQEYAPCNNATWSSSNTFGAYIDSNGETLIGYHNANTVITCHANGQVFSCLLGIRSNYPFSIYEDWEWTDTKEDILYATQFSTFRQLLSNDGNIIICSGFPMDECIEDKVGYGFENNELATVVVFVKKENFKILSNYLSENYVNLGDGNYYDDINTSTAKTKIELGFKEDVNMYTLTYTKI